MKKVIDTKVSMFMDYKTLGGEAYAAVKKEKERQIKKWGVQTHDVGFWLSILGEEVGECHKAFTEDKRKELRNELIQVATVAMNIFEALEFDGPVKNNVDIKLKKREL